LNKRPYTLHPLSKESSLKLLIAKAPRDIKNHELEELLKCKIPKGKYSHEWSNKSLGLKSKEK
jgi:hypothetical protein